jgi:hypothetical protein
MSDLSKSLKSAAQWLTEFVFLLNWQPFMMSSISLNSRNASKCLLRSLNHKPLTSNLIYLTPNNLSRSLIPRRESPEEGRLRCIRFYRIITRKKKLPGKLKNIFRRLFPISLKLLRYPSSGLYHSSNLGMRFLLGGKVVTPWVSKL